MNDGAFVFRMELCAHEPFVGGYLNDFRQIGIRIHARRNHSGVFKYFFVFVVEFVAVAVREIRLRDSIARVEALRIQQAAEQEKAAFDAARHDKSISPALENIFSQDSLTEKEITLENNKIKLHINTRGGCSKLN